jgi:ribosomal protein S24E
METKVIKQTKNPFLHREEYVLDIKADKNPNFVEIKQAVGKDESLTIVKKISGNFGRGSFSADVVVYDSMENKNKIEKISRKERRKLAEEAKKAAEAAKAGAQ